MRSVGRISTPGSIGYDLHYAEERKLPDGGREIILATNRPMSFWEMVRSAEVCAISIHLGAVPHATRWHR